MLDLSGGNYMTRAFTEPPAWDCALGVENSFLQKQRVVFRSRLIAQTPAWAPGDAALRLSSPSEP